MAWYDNEWGYSNRCVELAAKVLEPKPAAVGTGLSFTKASVQRRAGRRPARPRAGRLQRSPERGRGRRRHADSRRAADDRAAARPGAALVLVSHLERPKGPDPALSMAPVAARLEELLGGGHAGAGGRRARGGAAWRAARAGRGPDAREQPLRAGRDQQRSRAGGRLAALADLYVDDAFGAAHRAHATTEGVAHLLPGYAGLLLEREVRELTAVRDHPARPLCVVLGGAKVSDKVGVIERFLDFAEEILVGGAMCFSFFSAQGTPIGDSLIEAESIELAGRILDRAAGSRASSRSRSTWSSGRSSRRRHRGSRAGRRGGARRLDGARHRATHGGRNTRRRSVGAGTVFWNGPMGAFELEPFAAGTRTVAEAVAGSQGPPWSAAATRRRPLPRSGSRTGSTGCRPGAAPRSS